MYRYKRLFILVEGPSDHWFFDKVIKPEFERKYSRVHIRKHGEMKKELAVQLIDEIRADDDHYICVGDIDKAPCVSGKKQEMQEEKFRNADSDRMIIVVKEIEGWYLAGLDDDACEKLGLSRFDNTDEISKGQFKKLKSVKSGSDRDFMIEILRSFDIETAKRKNKSFKYFAEKYGL